MAIDFPASPTVGQQYTFAGTTYVFSAQGVWVSQAVASTPAWSTGDVKLTIKTIADTGWVLMNDGTIGNAASGATTRANADTSALFTLVWNNVSFITNVQDSSGNTVAKGASAAADYAANRRIFLPWVLGRALAGAGAGSGLTVRALGAVLGEENHILSVAEMPTHSHGIYSYLTQEGASGPYNAATSGYDHSNETTYTGGNTAHNNMQPTAFLNVMMKL